MNTVNRLFDESDKLVQAYEVDGDITKLIQSRELDKLANTLQKSIIQNTCKTEDDKLIALIQDKFLEIYAMGHFLKLSIVNIQLLCQDLPIWCRPGYLKDQLYLLTQIVQLIQMDTTSKDTITHIPMILDVISHHCALQMLQLRTLSATINQHHLAHS